MAKGGPKLKTSHEGSCVDIGLVTPLSTAPPPPAPGERPVVCGVARGNGSGPNVVLDVAGVSIDFFARTFLGIAIPDRQVVNRTGIVGLFDITSNLHAMKPTLMLRYRTLQVR